MAYIQLTQGRQAIVDDEDFEELSQYKWFYNHGYAMRHGSRKGLYYDGKMHGHGKLISMARTIINAPEGKEVDHININPLDNRKSNLRIVTRQENLLNKGLYKNNKTGVSGITMQKGKYMVRLWRKKVEHYIGYFDSLDKAIEAKQIYLDRRIES